MNSMFRYWRNALVGRKKVNLLQEAKMMIFFCVVCVMVMVKVSTSMVSEMRILNENSHC